MDENYGEKVGRAIRAVMQLHADIARLFRELDDAEYGGWDSVFGSGITKNVPKDVKKSWWMPYFMFRYYRRPEAPSLVEGITCLFFQGNTALKEPMLLVSQVRYGSGRHCGESDVLGLYPVSESQSRAGETIRIRGDEDAHIRSALLDPGSALLDPESGGCRPPHRTNEAGGCCERVRHLKFGLPPRPGEGSPNPIPRGDSRADLALARAEIDLRPIGDRETATRRDVCRGIAGACKSPLRRAEVPQAHPLRIPRVGTEVGYRRGEVPGPLRIDMVGEQFRVGTQQQHPLADADPKRENERILTAPAGRRCPARLPESIRIIEILGRTSTASHDAIAQTHESYHPFALGYPRPGIRQSFGKGFRE